MWSRFWHWVSDDDGWKALSGVIYLVICFFDFVIVPSWIGLTRPNVSVEQLTKLDPAVQIKVIDAQTRQHEPFTLKGGGLIHLAFGALLTGSAIVGRKGLSAEPNKNENTPKNG